MRELRKRAQREGVGVASSLPSVTAQMLFPDLSNSTTSQTPSTPTLGHVPSLYERIDNVSEAFKQHGISLSDYVQSTCAYDYAAQRAKEEPGFKLSSQDALEAEKVRAWGRGIGLQTLLQEAKAMENQKLLHTGSEYLLTCIVLW